MTICSAALQSRLANRSGLKTSIRVFALFFCWSFIFNLDHVSDLVYAAAPSRAVLARQQELPGEQGSGLHRLGSCRHRPVELLPKHHHPHEGTQLLHHHPHPQTCVYLQGCRNGRETSSNYSTIPASSASAKIAKPSAGLLVTPQV